MDVTMNEADHPGAANPAGGVQPTWPGTSHADCLTVACVDLGAGKHLAAFLERYQGPGQPQPGTARAYDAPGVRDQLADDLVKALDTGPVALGIEGPCWGLAEAAMGPYLKRECPDGVAFETAKSYWYGRNGGPAAMKAFFTLRQLLMDMKAATPAATPTYGLVGPPLGESSKVLIWEAFVTGAFKPPQQDKRPRRGILPQNETWYSTERGKTITPATPALNRPWGTVNEDVVDAFFAVRYGFSRRPTPLTQGSRCNAARTVLPIAGAAIEAAGLQKVTPAGWWNQRCLVIAPDGAPNGTTPTQCAHLFWHD